MAKFISPLKHVKIAAPCQANWEEMFSFADERIRFCSHCQLNVYNLSAMKQREAETLLFSTEGRLCVRFYRRADGTVLTQNCPLGLRAIKQRVSWAAQFILGMALSLLAGIGFLSFLPARKLVNLFASPVVMGAMVRPSEEYNQPEPVFEAREDVFEVGKVALPESHPIQPQKAKRLKRQ